MTYDYLRFVDNFSTHFFVRLWAHKLWFTTQAFYVLSSQIERNRKHLSESWFWCVCLVYFFAYSHQHPFWYWMHNIIEIYSISHCFIGIFRRNLWQYTFCLAKITWFNIEYAHTTVEIHNADNILLLCRHVAQLPQSIFHPFISPRMCKYLRGYCKNMIALRTHVKKLWMANAIK